MKKIIVFCCLAAFLLSACTHKSKRASAQEPLQPLTIGVMATMDGLPFLVAADKGMYDSLGLKVKFTVFLTESDRDASFETRAIDGMVTDYSSAAVLQAKGIPLNVIMQNDGYLCLLTKKGSNINSLSKLSNINFCSSPNSFAQYATDYVLRKAGISKDRVNEPEIGQIPLRLMMLQEGQIDATFLPDPYATIAMNEGVHSLISTQELNIRQMATAFSKDAIKNKAASIKALIKGYNQAVDYLLTHSEDTWADVLINQLQVPEDVVKLIVLPPYQYAHRPDTAEINHAIAWLKEKKVIRNNYNGTNLADSSFVEKNTPKISKFKKRFRLHHVRKHHK